MSNLTAARSLDRVSITRSSRLPFATCTYCFSRSAARSPTARGTARPENRVRDDLVICNLAIHDERGHISARGLKLQISDLGGAQATGSPDADALKYSGHDSIAPHRVERKCSGQLLPSAF